MSALKTFCFEQFAEANVSRRQIFTVNWFRRLSECACPRALCWRAAQTLRGGPFYWR